MYEARQARGPLAPAGPEAASSPVENAAERARPRISCLACGGFVADPRDRVSVNGAHAHSFINPAGIIFRVGCFATTPGARAAGAATHHWTWFPGFAWRAALCTRCGAHLGWCFDSADASFVALILDRVIERDSTDAPS